MDIVLLQPHTVEFVPTPFQFAGYQKGAQDWLKQWTVPNNFKSVITKNSKYLNLDIEAVVNAWFHQLNADARHAIGYMLPPEVRETYEFTKDFIFRYKVLKLEWGQQFWLADGVIHTAAFTKPTQ
ncbi:hypothetical protein [Ralstonia phage phiRSL1]|uniref:Uncharacterized protein n=1 Tax=Ralstonia phage phiRSL1 TaxID=1980924 RepID=B2ZXP7_9CAUD|nr:hypothetical protein RSL1_ORF027 [Ralstonia phage phiRSL1]BAG41472.1 hypothetical protein [Ralstonia phage phiRSL1]